MTSPSDQPVESFGSLARLVDVHLLDPLLSSEQVFESCSAARELGARAVVVRPCDLELATQWLRGSTVVLAAACGYPDGTSTTSSKLYEGRDLLRIGAKEVEFVLNPARMISRGFQHVETELLQMSRSCHEAGSGFTVVFNSFRLTDDLRIIATKVSKRVEADAIAIDGSEAELALLRPLVKDALRLKKGALVSSLEEALEARAAGFSSFATTVPAKLLEAWRSHLEMQAQPHPAVS